jgi:hypothetical protein
MKEAPVYKDDGTPARKDDVGPSREIRRVEPIPKPLGMKEVS